MGNPGRLLVQVWCRLKTMVSMGSRKSSGSILGSESAVVHEEELDIRDVADEERLVTGGGHVASLLVGAETDLERI